MKTSLRCTYHFFEEFISKIPFFYGRAVFCRIWWEGTCYLLSKILSALPRSFSDIFNTPCHADCCTRTQFFSPARYPGFFFGIRSARPLTATSDLKIKFFIPISPDEKDTTSGTKASANHLAPSSSSTSFGHATQWPTFLLRPPGYGVQEFDLILAALSGQSMCLLVKPRRGREIKSYFSPLSGILRHSCVKSDSFNNRVCNSLVILKI